MKLSEIGNDILFAGYVGILFAIARLCLGMWAKTQAARQFLESIPW